MFESARTKLATLYAMMFLVVTVSVSLIFYQGTTMVLQNRFRQIEQKLETRPGMGLRSIPLAERQLSLLKEDLEETKKQIASRLILINGAIVLVYAAAGYLISGKTLEPIERSLKEQEQFVANAAHELRTPLAAMKVTTEVELREKKLTGRGRGVLKDNLEEIEKLEGLTEKLLMLAHLDEVNKLKLEPVEMAQVVRAGIKTIKPKAKQKEIKMETRLGKITGRVMGDEELLRVLVTAILDNAVKYTPSSKSRTGRVMVFLTEDKKRVRLRVVDNGRGVEKEAQENLFKRFYRADESREKREKEGYGLGLALVDKIAELHGGRVWVKSPINRRGGAEFGVELARVE